MTRKNKTGFTLIAAVAMLTCACATQWSSRKETAEALDRVLAGDHRSVENKARDRYRHPKETLLFFGLRPEMTVVEVWPGSGGWYTEIIAPMVREKGQYYAAHWDPEPENQRTTDGLRA